MSETNGAPRELPKTRQPWQWSLRVLLVVTMVVVAYFAGVNHRIWKRPKELDVGLREPGPRLEKDFMLNSLPFAVADAYQSRFRLHRIWSIRETGSGKSTVYDLVLFDERSPTSQGGAIPGGSLSEVRNFHLVIAADGKILREDPHPIDAARVPLAVRRAFTRWSRDYPTGETEWIARQPKGKSRVFTVRVTLSSIAGYRANLNSDGSFIDKSTSLPGRTGAQAQR